MDESIKSLYASVVSAIECYKLESGNEVEVDLKPEIEIPEATDIGRKNALEAAAAMGNAAMELRREVKRSSSIDVEKADAPNRILVAVEN